MFWIESIKQEEIVHYFLLQIDIHLVHFWGHNDQVVLYSWKKKLICLKSINQKSDCESILGEKQVCLCIIKSYFPWTTVFCEKNKQIKKTKKAKKIALLFFAMQTLHLQVQPCSVQRHFPFPSLVQPVLCQRGLVEHEQ